MKKFVISFYGYNEDTLNSYALESMEESIAVVRALKKHDQAYARAYMEFLDETDSDIGSVSDIREFCHDVYKISLLEV